MFELWTRRRRSNAVDWWSVPPKLDDVLLKRRSGVKRPHCFEVQVLKDKFS